jgi:GTP-sensing pleiotropic transcriptional regulator CodY
MTDQPLRPARVADRFTMSELVALSAIVQRAGVAGRCTCSIAEIADRAGLNRNVVKTAIREAEGLGLLTVEPRARLELRSAKLPLR